MSNGRTSRASRAASLSLVMLMGALVLPTTAAAAGGYNVATINAECRGMAGNGWHTYRIKLKARIVARGTTPTDTLVAHTVAQRQRADGSWLTVAAWPDETVGYTPDGTTHSLEVFRSFLMPTTDQKHGDQAHRLKLRLSAYDGATLLFSDALIRTCVN
jgi:hypothetical protein